MEKQESIVRCSLCGAEIKAKANQYGAKCESCKKKIASRHKALGAIKQKEINLH